MPPKRKKKSQQIENEHRHGGQSSQVDQNLPLGFVALGDSKSDHCETPLRAIEDVCAILKLISDEAPANTTVYDPYYCAGTVKTHFTSCGYSSVINDPVDFYASIRQDSVPSFDVVVTNPPFSGDHINRLLAYLKSNVTTKPWCALLPTNVISRDWFTKMFPTSGDGYPCFLAPHERYSFGGMDPRNQSGASVTPLATMWYLGGISRDQKKEISVLFQSLQIAQRTTLALTQDELPRRIRKLIPFAKRKAERKAKRRKPNDS